MQINTIKTHTICHGELIQHILDQYIKKLEDNTILAITSKMLSVLEGRFVKKNAIDKRSLVYQEADGVLKSLEQSSEHFLTIKNGLLIPSAGIDESNANDMYILYPKNVFESATAIWHYLKKKHQLNQLGIIVTDSYTTLMRRGVLGITLAWCGFKPLYSYIGKLDLYNQPLKVTQINIVDALSVSAVFLMGEGNEQTPMALIKEAPHITYVNNSPTREEINSITIEMEEDLYAPLLKNCEWEYKKME